MKNILESLKDKPKIVATLPKTIHTYKSNHINPQGDLITKSFSGQIEAKCTKTYRDSRSSTLNLRVHNEKDRINIGEYIEKQYPQYATYANCDKISPDMTKIELYIPYYFPENLLKGGDFYESISKTFGKSQTIITSQNYIIPTTKHRKQSAISFFFVYLLMGHIIYYCISYRY